MRFKMRFGLILVSMLLFLAGSAYALSAPDAVFFNGKVVTVDKGFTVQQAFAVQGEKFIAVGTNKKVKALAGKGTRLVDLKGATVIPGLSDNHDHMFNTVRLTGRGVDMIGVSSKAEMQSRLKKAVATAKPGQVVFTTLGWAINPRPTRKDLDEVSAEVPIALVGSRRGVAVYNSAALKLAGITKESPTFAGMPVPKDASGEFTGASPGFPAAMHLLAKLLPPMTQAEEEEVIIRGLKERNALGITSIRELAVWPEVVQAYYRVWRQGKLTGRVGIGLEFPDQVNTAKHLATIGFGGDFGDQWLRIDSQGEEPWTPGAMANQPYTELMLTLNRLGWRPSPHSSADANRGIGFDDTTNQTMAAYEAADRAASIKDKRWYLEHMFFVTPEQIARIAKLNLIISTQDNGYLPQLAYFPKEKERLEYQNPVRSWLDAKLVVIGGSDYNGPTPDELHPNNPLIPFYFYVTRKAKDGSLRNVAQKISRPEALRIFTANTAYASFEEKIKGSIQAGMLADFVILSQDLMTVPDDKILETKPLATFVGGKKVYSAAGSKF
ncbi:MAG: amidohydrolase [Deltaproteobacteria bacterium]|nr:amidohydrolase [Deltaproteobacteria bacterium]